MLPQHTATHINTLQHTTTHRNTLQHTATHCNTLQHTATHCNTLQHTHATHCNIVQTHCNTLAATVGVRTRRCCLNTLQHTATHCNTLQRAATHCNIRADTVGIWTRRCCLAMIDLCHTYEWIMSHSQMSHVTSMNESCHIDFRVATVIWNRLDAIHSAMGWLQLVGSFKL